jgi:plasmid rolling circle replication initiator protein Rep
MDLQNAFEKELMHTKSVEQLKATEEKWSTQLKDCENIDKSKSNEIINKKVAEFILLKPSLCDCVNMGKEMATEMMAAKDDAGRKAVEEKYADQAKSCEKLGEGKTPEELKAMMEEAKNCK